MLKPKKCRRRMKTNSFCAGFCSVPDLLGVPEDTSPLERPGCHHGCCLTGRSTEIRDKALNLFVDDLQLNKVDDEARWQKIEAVMDSGAADSVAPASIAPWVPVAESPGSRRGQHYLSASGDRLPNQGQKRLQVLTEDGTPTTTTYQIADVTRPLCAVSRMCDQDNVVVFTKEGGFVQTPSGKRTPFRRERNVYLLDTWIREPERGFTRP